MIRWQKLGLIFEPDRTRSWMRSHAALPVAAPLDNGLCRIFFSSRDAENRSHVGYFDIDLDDPTRILAVSPEPVLSPGPLGFFDGDGVYAASAVRHEGVLRLYTIGWNRGSPAPLFYAGVGMAVSEDDGLTFKKHGRSPIMSRSDFDPSLVTSPFVLRQGKLWRMWYVSGDAWTVTEAGPRSNYHIKYAQSDDGVTWRRDGRVCIDNGPGELNIARSCIVPDGDRYHAWFSSTRNGQYRIGHAQSADGLSWERQPETHGPALSASGWDSEATAYPFVIRHRDQWLMFYNGNGFGRDGVGLAVAPV